MIPRLRTFTTDSSDVMLYDFVDLNRELIVSRMRDRVRARPWPSVAPGEVEHGRCS